MGKRKSKVAKQKQAKAAARGSKKSAGVGGGGSAGSGAFGVFVQRGAKGRRRDAQTNSPHVAGGTGRKSLAKSLNGSTAAGATASGSKGAPSGWPQPSSKRGRGGGTKHKFGNRKFARGVAAHAVGGTSRRESAEHDEHAEFDRQYQSMAERAYRRSESGGGVGGVGSSSKLRKGAAAAESRVRLVPATLSLAPPTSEQLVSDAADRVAGGMGGIGAALSTTNPAQPAAPGHPAAAAPAAQDTTNLLQVMAAKKREEWAREEARERREEVTRGGPGVDKNNPFAALHEDDSEDEEESKKKAALPAFSFAPASFSFGSAPALAVTAMPRAEDDPDL